MPLQPGHAQLVIQQAIHIIDDYQVDSILQDGENMVKECTEITHTTRLRSNYANSVQGIDAVVAAIQTARPNVYWENSRTAEHDDVQHGEELRHVYHQ